MSNRKWNGLSCGNAFTADTISAIFVRSPETNTANSCNVMRALLWLRQLYRWRQPSKKLSWRTFLPSFAASLKTKMHCYPWCLRPKTKLVSLCWDVCGEKLPSCLRNYAHKKPKTINEYYMSFCTIRCINYTYYILKEDEWARNLSGAHCNYERLLRSSSFDARTSNNSWQIQRNFWVIIVCLWLKQSPIPTSSC